MAAPARVVRTVPVGAAPMQDGQFTYLAFGNAPGLFLWEKTVQPPGFDGEQEISLTNMFNLVWRTFAPRSLITIPAIKTQVGWVPATYALILASCININQAITVQFADGSSITFWGYLKSFIPQEHKEGEQPQADCEIVVTNFDPVNRVEAGPNLQYATGTY